MVLQLWGNTFCAGNSGWTVPAFDDNSLVQFNIKEVLPADVNVLNAQLSLYNAASTGPSVSVSAYAVLKPWTTSATWNAHDGTHAWGQAGADQAGVDYTTFRSSRQHRGVRWRLA